MIYLKLIAHFFQGTYAKFGTSANLIREISVSVITAVAVAILVQLLSPKEASPAVEIGTLLHQQLARQHEADSVLAVVREWKLQTRIDSLTNELQLREEQDSLKHNANLDDVDAMDYINRAIDAYRDRTQP